MAPSSSRPLTPRRRRMLGTLAAAAGSTWLGRAWAQAARTVQLVVPFAPGTTPDLLARLLGNRLGNSNTTYVTDNRVGASGMIGLTAVARAAPDGNTLAVNTNTALTLPSFYKRVPFDVITSFTPVAMLGFTNFVLAVHPGTGFKSLADFINAAKREPNKRDYASPGAGTLHHLCMEMLLAQAGVQMQHVPYKGAANATSDLLGGQVSAMFLPVHVALAHAREGKLVILGSTRKEPEAGQPQIRPIAELGASMGLGKYDADGWYALWGPAGMAPDQVTRLNADINKLLTGDDEVKATFAKQGITARPMSSAQLLALAQAEFRKWQEVIAAAGIKPE